MEAIIAFTKQKNKVIDWTEVKSEFNKPGFLDAVVKFN
jgi:hypothetical protein